MYLLDLFAAKAAFLAMVVVLIIIPVWITIVAFTKKKGDVGTSNTVVEEEEREEAI
ncbi:MAG: hypothetical protein KDD19_24730 [Phaeodactylibacter sp.]|nr:hypothetical protein [Phaeodactylibacter sp.]MCB9050164.1 hypothetical protein [Lewinellaceae bacterium]